MNKKERLNKAFRYLIYIGKISTQNDVADAMKSTKQNVSGALNGNDKVLTDNFLKRFAKSFEIINETWLLTGEGEMLNKNISQSVDGSYNTQIAGDNNLVTLTTSLDKAINEISEQRKLVAKAQEQIDRLITMLENK